MQERLASSSKADDALLGLSNDELVRALSLVTIDGEAMVPTIAGILLLGKREAIKRIVPNHGGAFQVIEGATPWVDKDYCGPILSIVEDMESMLSGWNPGAELFDGFYRITIPEFNVDAVREGIVNAFGHRDYTVLGQVRVQIDELGLSISSPGGFIDGVTSANLLTVDPRGRNLCLMDALKRIGMAERTGRGVDRIYEGLLRVGRHVPEWTESAGAHVRLFIPRGNPDEGFMKMLEEARKRMGAMPSVWSMLALDALGTQGPLTARKLGEHLHMSQSEAEATLEGLLLIGLVGQESYNGTRRFFLNKEVYGQRYDHPGVTRTKIDSAEYPASVYDHVLRNGSVSTGEVMSMLDVSAKHAYRILMSLVDDGKIVRSGKGAATRYVLPDMRAE
ncbi:MAG: ATP-binding protein [Coriobacteriales bacterium]|nr:ATP-binding protein [Coriobacteriales bacterium]